MILMRAGPQLAKAWPFLVLAIGTYVLTPRFVEPGGESMKMWFANRLFLEGRGFPLFSHGPLYVVYLSLFRGLDFPWSLAAEYFTTHLFCYGSIYLLLRCFLPAVLAIFVACAWIPTLATIEGSNTVAGIGFLALFLWQSMEREQGTTPSLPVLLLCSVLCQSANLVFLIGHLGEYTWRKKWGPPLRSGIPNFIRKHAALWCKVVLLVIMVGSVLAPAHHRAYNHICTEEDYVPEAARHRGFVAAFFQIYSYMAVARTVPEEERIYQDWFFTVPRLWGTSANPLEAALYNPDQFFANFCSNLGTLLYVPQFFLVGFIAGVAPLIPTLIVSWVLTVIGFVHLVRRAKNTGRVLVGTLTVGIAGVALMLSLTWVNPRYFVVLLPVFLLIQGHLAPGLIGFFHRTFRAGGHLAQLVPNQKLRCAVALVGPLATGIPFVVAHRSVIPVYWGLYSTAYLASMVLYVSVALMAMASLRFIPTWQRLGSYLLKRHRLQTTIFLTSALVIGLTTTWYNLSGWPVGSNMAMSLGQYSRGLWLLQSPSGFMNHTKELQASIRPGMKILLSNELTAVGGFLDVDVDKIYSIFVFPPYPDPYPVTTLLNTFDEIWVRDSLTIREESVSTQSYLRFAYHIQPFIETLSPAEWCIENIDGYGFKILKLRTHREIPE